MGLILPAASARIEPWAGDAGALDLLFFYTPDKAYSLISAYGEPGRGFYRNFELTIDILYPVVYALFLSLLISWLFQRGFSPESPIQRMNVAPLGAWGFDLLENLGIVWMLETYPSASASLAWTTALCTMGKWIFVGASMILILLGAAAALRRTRSPIPEQVDS